MPRGNDSTAALVDLQGQFAGSGGNAEQLIRSAHLAITPELRTALLQPRNEKATIALLNDDGLDKVQKQIDDGTVIDIAVRGDWVVAVVEADSGRTFKEPVPWKKVGGPERSRVRVPQESSEVQDMRAQAQESLRNLAIAQEAAKAAEEAAEAARANVAEEQAKARASANDPKAEKKAEEKK